MESSVVDVLILSTVEGHYSIACAVEEALLPAGLSCHIAVCPDRILHLYRWFYRHFPSLLLVSYRFLEIPFSRYLVGLRLRGTYTRLLFELLDRHRPRILVCTNYAFEPSIARHRARIPIPYVNVVTDPRTFFRINLSTAADVNCMFDRQVADAFHRLRPRARTVVTGWLVRAQFTPPADRGQAKADRGLRPDVFTILVAAGSEGSSQVMNILPGIVTVRRPVQIVVACGNNEVMRGQVEAMGRALAASASPVTLIALSFTREIHRDMQAADLVVGKAGPNMLFESVAVGAPFFAITHVHGQEDGNLDIIHDYCLGFVEENPWRARMLLRAIIEGRETLDRFLPPIRALAAQNSHAGPNVLRVVRELIARAAPPAGRV